MQNKRILFLLAGLFLLFTNPVLAGDAVIYHSGELTVNAWHVHLSRHTFEVGQSDVGFLTIEKNTPGMSIQAGFLILNHRFIPLTRFLTGPAATFTKKIRLRRANRLSVFLIGSTGAAIRITVRSEAPSQPPPTVAFSAEPATIAAGSASTLSWSCEHADTCMLAPGIGAVDPSGSLNVRPTETTTYTITAGGSGGSVSSSATVTVTLPAPTVALSAAPAEITRGASTTLTWVSANADACAITPDIGSVAPNGSLAVSPLETTTYTIGATGPGGTATGSAAVRVTTPISLQIISPSDGETVNRSDVLVRGTFANANASETGITVNGKVAMVYGNQFVVNHLPLQPGTTIVTATATDSNGHTQTAASEVVANLPEHHIKMTPTIESGSAPLEVNLQISGTFSIGDSTLAHTGPQPVDLMETAPDEYQARLTGEGIHYFTAEAVHEGLPYTDTVAIVVVDTATIDALLQQKWADTKTKLSAQNVEGATQHFEYSKQSLYAELFSALIDKLPQIVDDMQAIALISITDRAAKYRIRRLETHNTGTHSITHYIYFIMDDKGIWKILRI